ncbi:Uncharacterised protein [Salmonella enterica subsp. salamae]|uniref:Uncharacterized protein n=1 Tax=Salmonella enterica TaxID=28901 RepID=A0A379SHE5_SALER|nr:Uncharacterised protein [Salmonella enterica]SUJ12661.1 Uncharacterised protein [Salmonella enterica subsp. salamae]
MTLEFDVCYLQDVTSVPTHQGLFLLTYFRFLATHHLGSCVTSTRPFVIYQSLAFDFHFYVL